MAQKVQIIIDQGSTFSRDFSFLDNDGDPIDFSTYSANSQMRKFYSSSNSFSFNVSLFSNGQITLGMTANTTGSIEAGRYVYDLEVQAPDGTISRLVEGVVTVTPQVTR